MPFEIGLGTRRLVGRAVREVARLVPQAITDRVRRLPGPVVGFITRAASGEVSNPFHEGERRAQARAGGEPHDVAIRDRMSDDQRALFGTLPFLPAATTDQDGWPAATLLTGSPGFIASPHDRALRIAAVPHPADPCAAWFRSGARIGLLGIDLASRQRARANGTITEHARGQLDVAVVQAFGNCPQYIHIRAWQTARANPGQAVEQDGLDDAAAAMIRAADTMFVASSASGSGSGVDISHRGGQPGFVRVDGDVLTIPDFAGNGYFNTLGNLVLDPRAALLVPGFATGDLLHVQGHAEIVWHIPERERIAGAQRLWRLHVTRMWRRAGALPLRWELRRSSPGAARTGHW